MQSFSDWIEIEERKQVGILYHFTRISSLQSIEDSGFCLGSHQDYISFTRNFDMINPKKYDNELSLGESSHIVRIAIDGDKLSDLYKIEPFIDVVNNIKRKQGEDEERVLKAGIKKKHKDRVCIKKCIIQIDIIDNDNVGILKDLKSSYNIVKKFKRLK